MTQMTNHRRAFMLGLTGLGTAIATRALAEDASSKPVEADEPRFIVPPLAPIKLSADRITRITVCMRPFRAAGPRLEVETIGHKRVVHNYGHGGSGWSLSWGSSTIAARYALEGGKRDIAVIGCGALGLTSALLLRRAGAKVTIYAKERPQQARSFRATGTWSPDSRIADADKVASSFPALWEDMARTSYATYQTLLGLPGEPVAWTDRYALSDDAPKPRAIGAIHFAEYEKKQLADITPPFRLLTPGTHPFPVNYVRHGTSMQFNVTELSRLLLEDFLREGGQIETMTFNTPADLARLKQSVIVNCTGYGARALWKDESIIPVRGQIAWLPAQPEARYGVYYKNVVALPRPDGIVVQQAGENDMWGYGIDNETADHAESEAAIATFAGIFDRKASPRP